MARYTEAKCKQCRREGAKLYLKGTKCLNNCTLDKRTGAPGAHPGRGRMSNYGRQFREKQKVKRIYGLLEAQFRRFFAMAKKDPMQTGAKLLQLLERRLDNALYRMGISESRNQTRQFITHGHVKVNGKKVSSPAFLVKIGDVIEFNLNDLKAEEIEGLKKSFNTKKVPAWLEVNEYGKAKVVSLPERSMLDQSISEQLIVEYYSR